MSNHEAAGAAITGYSEAVARHKAAVKRLTEFGTLISRLTGAKNAADNWKLSDDPDPRRNGGILCGDGIPIMPGSWPTFEQVAEAIRERDASDAARDTALAQLNEPGLNPDDWK